MSLATKSTPVVAPAPTPAGSLPRRRLGFALTGAASTLMLTGASAPSPFYPELEERLGIGAIGVTVAFAIYAVALLIALLTVGSISDHLGRRPVIAVGFVLLAVAVLMLWRADSGGVLYLARVVQGLASGALISTLSATIADFAPPARPQNATLLNTLAPMGGLALGTIIAGVLLQTVADAATWTFVPLAVAYLLIAALIFTVLETSPRERGWMAALRPRASVPAAARKLFGVSVPIVLAGWATGGLFFSLGPSIVHAELGVSSELGAALVVGVLPASGAVAAFALYRRRPIVPAVYGAVALAAGTAIMLLALVLGSLPVYVVAVVVAGTGFGTAFMGTIGSLVPLTTQHERAELFAALYIVSYLSFGVPAVIAGLLTSAIGLHLTVLLYGAVVALAAGVASVLRARTGTVAATA
ncbi:MFS transporter [Herbiconiux sp. KACC 21604]|uniref:MFS transporter n=1 Tax=unclassified Herbiconiux TaxID=2618217 RepID=UPI001490BABC|nr:MFS transporter [Herbiconiux sp. SALV-R1]QJU55530.1 MFS transporter [Herbiconiux sp. SALV-R1]WPO86715.1 MFS transporter [Herbiconiux sp. KACC 21604]